jgi:hypothetical protein
MPLRLIVDNQPSGEILKDEGVALSLKGIDPGFRRKWEDTVYDLLEGWKGIAEEIRLALEAQGFKARHKNWWGTLTSMSIKRGALRKTYPPEIWNARDPKGHIRECRVLIRTNLL